MHAVSEQAGAQMPKDGAFREHQSRARHSTLLCIARVVVGQPVLEADLGAAILAGVCVYGCELLSAAGCRALWLPVHLCVVAGVTPRCGVPLEGHIGVLARHHSDGLGTDWADDDLRGFASGLLASMRRVRPMLQAVHQLAAVASEWKEVNLATKFVGAVPAY
jgi:hypothetical protein